MKGYRAVFKGKEGDPDATPASEPKRTRWFLKREEAAKEADLLNAKHHALTYGVEFEEDSVDAYHVVWFDRVGRENGEMLFYAPMKEGGNLAAHAYLRLMLGEGNFSIHSVTYVRAR